MRIVTGLILLSTYFIVCAAGVEVYSGDRRGKPKWQDAEDGWRDRSSVPRPSAEAVESYRRRSRIPVPHSHLVKHVHVTMPYTDGSDTKKTTSKKNFINRIFFTLPIGGQFPIYYSSRHLHKPGKSNKKSKVTIPGAIKRNFAPYRSYKWGRPYGYSNYRNLPNNGAVQGNTYGRQWIPPPPGRLMYLDALRNRYLNSRMLNSVQGWPNRSNIARANTFHRILTNRAPLQYTGYRTRLARSISNSKKKHYRKSKHKVDSASRKAVIRKGETFEGIMAKLKPKKKT